MRKKLSDLVKVYLVPISRISGLSLLSLRKLPESQDSISSRQSQREVGGGVTHICTRTHRDNIHKTVVLLLFCVLLNPGGEGGGGGERG